MMTVTGWLTHAMLTVTGWLTQNNDSDRVDDTQNADSDRVGDTHTADSDRVADTYTLLTVTGWPTQTHTADSDRMADTHTAEGEVQSCPVHVMGPRSTPDHCHCRRTQKVQFLPRGHAPPEYCAL